MYTEAVEKFRKSKETGDFDIIKESLRFLCNAIQDAVQTEKYELFSDFIRDEHNVFYSTRLTFSYTEADVTITTTGYVDQLLEMLGNKDHEHLSRSLAHGVFGVYGTYSSQNGNMSEHVQKLLYATNQILDIVS